jgi:hypothetical protein
MGGIRRTLKAEVGNCALDVFAKIEREVLEEKCEYSSRKTRFWEREVSGSSRAALTAEVRAGRGGGTFYKEARRAGMNG